MNAKLLSRTSLVLIGMLFTTWVHANAPGDFGPSPEEQLAKAGIDTSILSMTIILGDSAIDVKIRYWCAIALGRTKNIAVAPILRQTLEDSNPEMRFAAVKALGELTDVISVDRISEMLAQDQDEGVRSMAAYTLSKMGTEKAITALAATAGDTNETNEALRINAAFWLGRSGKPFAKSKLRKILNDPNIKVRTASAISLELLNDRASIPYLADAALDPFIKEWLRTKAIRSLEKITGERFGYFKPHHEATNAQERAEALDEIRRWWQGNKSEFYKN